MPNEVEDLLRELAPQVLGTLSRRYGDFDTAEDAVQEALIAASTAWPRDGVPANPRGWLLQTASRRLIDHWRSDRARQRREAAVALQEPRLGEAPEPAPDEDDTLPVLFMCCHPALTPASAIALTLRAVGGLTTAEIASAFLVPEATMAQRISRAKQRIAASGGRFRMPTEEEYAARRASVLHVLYLVFNEGYAASSGSRVEPGELAAEAIRLTRLVHRALPEDTEVMGLLALMLLLDARRPARTGPSGALVSLADQDRTLWDGSRITEGLALLDRAVAVGAVGEYQLQAAIAAVHDRASQADETDWPEIRALYGLLERMTGSPVVTLNRAVAAAMAEGPEVGLAVLDEVGDRLAGNHRLDAVRAHLLELAGDSEAARSHYRAAAARTTSRPERDYLTARAARVGS
ncbi:RNA polymerase sigma factor [Intrasporangium oryzae]|uniref:RNA polymerase sigma factor n=1 Tax=Intrasporangium oryzae TaxID=412687 RepID=UPI0004B05DB0|nr:sigma-70 family RNA polymerase sigma factor [Intrasporangium oryzae]